MRLVSKKKPKYLSVLAAVTLWVSFGVGSGRRIVTAGSEATADSVVPEVEARLTFLLAHRRMSLCLAKVVETGSRNSLACMAVDRGKF